MASKSNASTVHDLIKIWTGNWPNCCRRNNSPMYDYAGHNGNWSDFEHAMEGTAVKQCRMGLKYCYIS